ncbi:MAG: roadblock/LC7 domain-containing protein [Coriobacteriia bacterium]|nr:roadblock/LC7 domain-containing protein [Coriobacteriia bacterium]
MVDKGIGDYFITDADDEPSGADELLGAPVVVPVIPPRVSPVEAPPAAPAPAVTAAPPVRPAVEASVIEALTPTAAPRPQVAARPATREEQLAEALDELMRNDGDIQAAALVSLDGFTMASALPAGMQADRVGAMSAAILGLGERAAAELGRGHLSQVFIEGENGYVLLIAAGSRAVLTAMAEPSAKLGLVLYDMKSTADRIGQILG